MPIREQKKRNPGFGPKPEPAGILAGVDLTDTVAVVTGGYSGIGLETSRALAAAGAKVHVPARDAAKATAALAGLPRIQVGHMDLGDLASVARYGAELAELPAIDLLINNAGIMACPETRVGKGWEAQFAVNHLGHFALTKALLPALLRAAAPRAVCLSSIGHRRSDILWDDIHFRQTPYEKWTAYAQSKTANALFALGLDIRHEKDGLRAFSVHPGGILTPLQRHLTREEMVALGWVDETGALSKEAAPLFKTPSQGCATTLWAATSPVLAGTGGLYCEDCDVADLATEDSPRYLHVAPWAVNEDSAQRLWELSEAMLAEAGVTIA